MATSVPTTGLSHSVQAEDVALDADISFAQFLSTRNVSHVVSSRNWPLGDWNIICELKHQADGVYKRVLPIDFRDFCMLVITKVAPHTSVPKHSHEEGIVRYIMEGTLVLNGVEYRAGDWILVPEGVPYEIQTTEGYSAIAGYLVACSSPASGK